MIFNLLNILRDHPDCKIFALSLNEGILSRKLQKIGIKVFIIPEERYSFPVILLKARKILKCFPIDIIHSHRYKENLLALLLRKLLGVKLSVATMHGLAEPTLHGESVKNQIHMKTRMDYFILKTFFTRVIAVSREMQDTLTNQYSFKEERLAVIHNGIEIPQVIQSINQPINQSADNIFRIGTVGRLTPVKDYSLFLDIAAEIRMKRKDVRFYILGEGPLKRELQNKMMEMNLDDCVTILEPVTDPFPFYRSLCLYLNTSSHEGIPMSILEAMMCGLPVIAPEVGGIPEIFEHNQCGVLFNERSSKEIAGICMQLLVDLHARTEMGRMAKKRIQRCFNASSMANSYYRQYVSL